MNLIKTGNLVKYFAVLAALAFPTYILVVIAYYYANVPFWDSYDIGVAIIKSFYSHHLNWYEFWQPHVGHRLVLTRLFFLADYLLLHGNQLAIILITFVLQILLWLIFVVQLKALFLTENKQQQGGIHRYQYWALIIVISAMMFAPQLGQIWFWAVLLQCALTTLFFVAALFSVKPQPINKIQLITPIIFALLATLSSFNGLIVWPTLVTMLILNRYPYRYIGWYVITGLIVIIGYAYHLPLSVLTHVTVTWFERIDYFFAFLGSPFGYNSRFSELLGMLSFGLYLICAGLIFLPQVSKQQRNQLIPWLALAALGVGSAILGSIGRAGIAGVAQALSDRYISFSAPFWIGLFVIITVLYRVYGRYLGAVLNYCLRIIMGLVSIMLLTGYCLTAIYRPITARTYQNGIKLAELALKNDIYLVNPLLKMTQLYPVRKRVLKNLSFLRQHSLVFFHERQQPIIGKNIRQLHLVITKKSNRGRFNSINFHHANVNTCKYGFDKGLATSGWVAGQAVKIDTIYIVNGNGRILGLGKVYSKHPYLSYLLSLLVIHNTLLAWRGFVGPELLAQNSRSVKLYAYVKYRHHNQLYRIPGVQQLKTGYGCTIPAVPHVANVKVQ